MNRECELLTIAVCLTLSMSAGAAGQTFGDPLPGLTPEQLALFVAGEEEFAELEKVETGLGPTFNNTGCGQCHFKPKTGGSSPQNNEVRAGQRAQPGASFVDLAGGSLFQIRAINPGQCGELLPDEANVVAFRQTQPLFGMGLIEAIRDATIEAQAAISGGRVSRVFDPATGQTRVGRFGWKAQVATLLTFSGDAYLNEMGITSDLFPEENAPNGDTARLAACDTVPDPEDVVDPATGRRDIDDFTNFMRFLGPPPRGKITTEVVQGETIFAAIGCARCHTPVMQTGPDPIAALSNKPVNLYSDLLLHDIGTGDGIPQAAAGADEIRTAPLWGLKASQPFLHDGSAPTAEQAVLRHAGEASAVTDAFRTLSRRDKDLLIAFLNSL